MHRRGRTDHAVRVAHGCGRLAHGGRIGPSRSRGQGRSCSFCARLCSICARLGSDRTRLRCFLVLQGREGSALHRRARRWAVGSNPVWRRPVRRLGGQGRWRTGGRCRQWCQIVSGVKWRVDGNPLCSLPSGTPSPLRWAVTHWKCCSASSNAHVEMEPARDPVNGRTPRAWSLDLLDKCQAKLALGMSKLS